MKLKRDPLLHSLVKKLAATRFVVWLFAPLLHRLDAIALRLTRNRHTLSGILTGVPTAVITTTGAKTGKAHTLTLLRVPDPARPDVFAVIASNWSRPSYPAWYYNLKANPRARCSIDGHASTRAAHEAEGEEYERLWAAALAIFPGYEKYKQRLGSSRRIPIMVMTPL